MCGIAAALGDFDHLPTVLPRMLARLRHRGPDGDAVHIEGNAGLGLARLAIVRPDSPAQIFRAAGVAAVTNGEIYNAPRTRTVDTAVVPAWFAAEGPGFARRLRGMYAIALLEAGGRRLHLFRDPLGKKPLFYRRHHGGWLAASEIKALFVDEAPRVDTERAARAFARGFLDDHEPFFADVRAVPPGGHVILEDGVASVTRLVRFDEALEDKHVDVDDALTRAVRRRALVDVKARCLLSGGMDSAVIAARSGLPCANLEVPGRSERARAKAHAKTIGADLRVDTPAPPSRDALRRALFHLEVPDVGGVWEMSSSVLSHAQALAADGVKVVLSGEGADELFLGYPWQRHEAALRLLWKFNAPSIFPYGAERMATPGARAYEVWRRAVERPMAARIRNALTTLFPTVDVTRVTRPGPARAAAPHVARRLQLDALEHDMLTLPVLHADRLWMAHGIEARLPFLDVDLVRLALRIPQARLLDRQHEKRVVRELFARDVGGAPPTKLGFSAERRPRDDDVLAFARELLKDGVRVVDGDAFSALVRGDDAEVAWRAVVIEECARALD